MKPTSVILIATAALFIGSYFWLRTARQNVEALRAIEIERRDQWFADTIANLRNGESSVYLYSCANTDLLLEKIAGMPEVERIVFEQTNDLSATGLHYLPSFPNLRHLDFRGEKALNDETIVVLARCKNLETLGVKLCGVSDDGIPTIAEISTLREFRHSRNIGQTALSALIERSPGIRVVESEWYN